MKRTVLLLSGETAVMELTVSAFAQQRVVVLSNPVSLFEWLQKESCSLLLVDFVFVGSQDFLLLKKLVALCGSVPVVVISSEEYYAFAVAAIKNGAADFVRLPIEPAVLASKMHKYMQNKSVSLCVTKTDTELLGIEDSIRSTASSGFASLLGDSPVMQRLKKQLALFSASEEAVLLQGESGTGKTFIARLIHENSARCAKKFRNVNVAEIPETIAESELMGTVCGSFTGAVNRQGYFEQVNGGSLFLDEIGSLSLSMQAKLLQLLESETLYRIGSAKPVTVDVRLLFASNVDLRELIERKKFREDLFWRIYELIVRVPPLRQRLQDIPVLVQHFLAKTDKILSRSGMDKLVNHLWPGNIRELSACVRRAIVTTGSRSVILADDLVF